ncbi:MAG: porphobilinogen synthase [Thermoplasmata archaeon]
MPPSDSLASGSPRRGSPGRLRRLRARPALRDLVAEADRPLSHLVQPMFVGPAAPGGASNALPAMARWGIDGSARTAERLYRAGIQAALLFGVPARKDPTGEGAWDARGPVPKAIRAIRARTPDLAILADVCLCEYTDHGHCGLVRDGRVDNDRTLPVLGKVAVAYAEAGADLVAPSAMMDHQVAAIREALDNAGYPGVGILAYAAKFASSFYGPFRDAAGSMPAFGDRRDYQMDPRNGREALRELREDEREGADVLMVKPAGPYLDVLAAARRASDLPLAAFQVSGEYAMIKAAAQRGWLDERAAVRETLTSIRRAGADLVITYFAGDEAQAANGEGR